MFRVLGNAMFKRSFATIVVKSPAYMGDGVTTAEMREIMKNVGMSVKMDEVVCEIEGGKATVELFAPQNGVVSTFHVKLMESFTPGDPIFSMTTD